jgi:taurine dioxygenase
MAVTTTPLGAPLGAVVEGYDFATPPDADELAQLRAAVDEHLVVIFRNGDHRPSHAEVVRFCQAVGPLRPTLADRSRLPEFPVINLVSNVEVDGVVGTGGHGLVDWHSDLHFEPPLIELLFLDAVQLTSWGGRTCWTNLCAAYDALGADDRALIDDLAVHYRLRDDLDYDRYFRAGDGLDRRASTTVSLVQRNPRTGRPALWANVGPGLFHAEVVGMDPDESAELLQRLYRHCTQEAFVYRHEWAPGDACLWLNTQTMHLREPFPGDEVRVLRHLNILGTTDPHQLEPA